VRGAIEGERKQVSVLFCDIVGSSALAAELGPEEFHLVIDRFSGPRWPRCTAMRARSTSSSATGSWRCSGRRSRARITPGGRCWPRSASPRSRR
jgi:hypothetical protein